MQQGNSGDPRGNFQKIGEGLGGLAGQAADAAAGMLGTMMSNMGGWWAQAARGHAEASTSSGEGGFTASFSADRDAACRRHYETGARGSAARSYDDVRPLYQFGHTAGQNPDYQGRSFDQVEMDLQRAWGEDQRQRHGGWPDVRGFVEFGYSGSAASAGGAGGQSPGGYGEPGGPRSTP